MHLSTRLNLPLLSVILHSKTQAKVDENAFVTLNQGQLQGLSDADHFAFYGIPYAKPPTGSLRWRKPENPDNWSGTRDSSVNNKPGCLQDPGHITSPDNISEDCLFINIYTPKFSTPPKKDLPVMLWIHGGSWKHGHSAAPLYNGKHLVQDDVILVSMNYRMGAMGFLYTLEDAHVDGNQAVWDMIKALEWVNSNIGQFYGDTSKITIFGESAGGQSVATLLSLIENNGRNNLFSQAIIQSDPWGIPYKTQAQGNTESEVFMQELGCTSSQNGRTEYDWDCARSKDGESLLIAQQATRGRFDTDMVSSAFEAWTTPVIDDELLDSHPLDAIRAGRSGDKNIMIGHTTGEGAVFVYAIFGNKVGKITYETFVNLLFGEDSKAVLNRYPSPCKTIDLGCDARDQLSQIAGSYLFDCPARHAIIPRSNSNFGTGDTFHYIFDHPIKEGIFPDDSMFAACDKVSCHGAEVAFVFGSFEDLGVNVRPAETTLSNRMMTYWTNFAKNGNPNLESVTKAVPCWYDYSSVSSDFCGIGEVKPPRESMHLLTGEFDDVIDPDAVNQHCVFWDSLDAYLKY